MTKEVEIADISWDRRVNLFMYKKKFIKICNKYTHTHTRARARARARTHTRTHTHTHTHTCCLDYAIKAMIVQSIRIVGIQDN